ncbi:hypothetical protein [Haliea sp.]|uniref:hypothetical protein n=1 Tax=Haliea sp. TaxID=1932666 RepID=UPI00257F9F9E|nr:hypothetical protein [Haliea sp.]|tara:strand:- start:605 stop:1879 length:1275 start_codon:yes stop_codon:yes gene_type:complete
MAKYGFSSLNSNLNRSQQGNFLSNLNLDLNQIRNNAVRVKDIVLDQTHPRFEELGAYAAIGTIEFADITIPTEKANKGDVKVARPLFINEKHFPVPNEIVYLVKGLPTTSTQEDVDNTILYYITVVNIWNHPHHNALPAPQDSRASSDRKSYNQAEAGSFNIVNEEGEVDFFSGNFEGQFVERENIHPLQPFIGDIIKEGRWGNSIRLGSTVKGASNSWSSTGQDGDPITIFRNGQNVDADNRGFIPIPEDVNKDQSSIYLTSTQKLPLKINSDIEFGSYEDDNSVEIPKKQDQYSDSQIILNSGRLVFNAKNDHILLSADKSININSAGSVNIDAFTNIILSSDGVQLGVGADESLVLGDTLVSFLETFLNNLSIFLNTGAAPAANGGGPIASLNSAAVAFSSQLSTQISDLRTLLSTQNKTI